MAGGDLSAPGNCIFGMRVTETLSFDQYWLDPRFEVKKPLRNGSRVMMLGLSSTTSIIEGKLARTGYKRTLTTAASRWVARR
jgi:hypothetical protein